MYKEKIHELCEVLAKSTDSDCLDYIVELIEDASYYVRRVNLLEIEYIVGRYSKEGQEYRDSIKSLDELRSAAHETLISNVKLVNKICRKYNLPLLFEGDEKERVEIAEFANSLVEELFKGRKK